MPESGQEEYPAWLRRAIRDPGTRCVVNVHGCAVAYRIWDGGGSSGIIMVHGGGASSLWWAPSAHILADAGYRVAALDLSGHGDSGWRAHYSARTWASEVIAVAREADTTSIVVGHSMGGFVAATAAATDSLFSGLILVDSAILPPACERPAELQPHAMRGPKLYVTPEDAVAHFRVLPSQPQPHSHMTSWIAENSIRPIVQWDEPTRWTWKFDPAVFQTDHSREAHAYLSRIHMPVVLIRGERSRVMTAERAKSLDAELSVDLYEIVVARRHHHLILEDPTSFSAAVVSALAVCRDAGSKDAGSKTVPASGMPCDEHPDQRLK